MSWAHVVTFATCWDKPCVAAVVPATYQHQGRPLTLNINLIFRWKDKQVVVRLPMGGKVLLLSVVQKLKNTLPLYSFDLIV